MSEPIRVLVVDEDPHVRDLTETFLEREDDHLRVQVAGSGDEALDLIEDEPFDAVVSDYRMPGVDGLELAAAVDERDIDVAFVLFSAADDPNTSEAVEAAAVDEFVLKGSGTDHFTEIVDAIRDNVDGHDGADG